ncbi:MAG: TolC family protein [Bacteroidaceae bacterium]|nr:TolC family protein [Bacteroidaceae bacterium]
MKYKLIATSFVWLLTMTVGAQQILTLDSCRALALRNNKALRMGEFDKEAAHWQHKAATSHYFPRVNAVGGYMRTSRQISILSDDQKAQLSNMGTTTASQMQAAVGQMQTSLSQNPLITGLMTDPLIAGMVSQSPALQQLLLNQDALVGSMINAVGTSMGGSLNSVGQGIVDAFNTDTRNLCGLTVMLTQPLYMGGKIRAYDKITNYAEKIAANKQTLKQHETIVEVDEAYWRIVGLESKKALAESYLATVRKLDGDVDKLVAEGLATKADGLSVKVKVNEAEVTVIQVENGLALSRMALCQLCGLPLDTSFRLADEALDEWPMPTAIDDSVESAFAARPELQALTLAASVKDEQVKVARSEFMPNLALTAGYAATSPSLFNGFEKKLKGMWNIGVVLKVPVITWGERLYKVRQAKAEAAMAHVDVEEVREKVELQVSQNRQKVQEASQRLAAAIRSQQQADENLRIANLGMTEGVIPVSNVLEAQTGWLMAKSTRIQAQIDWTLADLYLRKALGKVM